MRPASSRSRRRRTPSHPTTSRCPSTKKIGYPEYLDVTPNGRTLVVPLNLANFAAIVDVKSKSVRYAKVGRYPYAAAVLPDGRRALVSNETTGTVSVVDLATAKVVKTITTGGHLVAPGGDRGAQGPPRLRHGDEQGPRRGHRHEDG